MGGGYFIYLLLFAVCSGADNDAVHRLPWPHLLVLLRLPGREGRRSLRLRQLRGRTLVGSGELRTHSLFR